MALPVNIDDLIHHRKVEQARIEYKAGWNPEKVLHTLCAFANDIDNWGGGYVILGVEEENGMPKFPVKGVPQSSIDAINKDLLEKCHLIEPAYVPVVEPIEYEGKHLIVIWAPGGYDRPYRCPVVIRKNQKSEKAYYIRKIASTVKASRADERMLFDLSGDIPFDDQPNVHAKVEDLKANLMVEYLHEVGSDLAESAANMSVLDLARNLRVVSGADEFVRPLNCGLMFFSFHPEQFFRYAWIEVVDKPDPTGQGMVEKYFKGPLHVQLREALGFIRNYILKEKIFKVDGRAEADRHWNYPYRAIEEALTNAVYHKSYRKPEPIVVTFTPERMEINSIPGPDRSITAEAMASYQLHSRFDRNRRIGEFLKELDLAEARNTGYPAIIRALKTNGSPLPVLETDDERRYFTFILPVHPVFLSEQPQGDVVTEKSSLAPNKSASKTEKAEFLEMISALDLYRPTRANIERLFACYGFEFSFSRLMVMRKLGIQRSNAGTFMAKLQALDLVEPMQGEGRGKFKFRRPLSWQFKTINAKEEKS